MKKIVINNSFRLFILLILCLFISSCLVINSNLNVVWFVLVGTISLAIIIKLRESITKMDIIIAMILMGVSMTSSIFMGLFVFPSYLASILIFKNSSLKLSFYTNAKEHNLRNTLILIFIVGGVFAVINLLMSGMPYNPSIKLKWFCDALRAGIFEEIFFRMFFFAMCAYILKEQKLNTIQNILCYLIMILPHVLIHFNSSNFNLVSVIFLSVLFGLPFALMQRKQNVISAIGAHALVDLIRFSLLGV